MADGYYNPHTVPPLTCANALCAPETPRCVESPTGPKCVAVKTCSQLKCKKGERCEQPEKFKDAQCIPDTTAPHGACNLFCIQGRRCIVTPSGARCVPTPTCNDLKCPAGKVCKQDDTNKAASCVLYQAGGSQCFLNALWLEKGGAGSDARCIPNLGGFVGRNAASFDSPSDCPLSCGGGTKCVMAANGPTCMRGRSCDDINCPRKTKCLQNSITQEAVCVPTATCDVLDCRDGYQCIAGGANEDAQCVPFDTCDTLLCPPNTRCIETDTGAQCSQTTGCDSLHCYVGTRCIDTDAGSHFLPPDEADRIQVQCRLAKCIKGRVCQDFMRKVTCVADQNPYFPDGPPVPIIPTLSDKPDPMTSYGDEPGAGKQSDAQIKRIAKPRICRADEVLNQCGSRCEPTCANAGGDPKICPAICDPPACVCASGLFRRGGQCVTKQQCLEKDSMTGYGDEPEVPPLHCTANETVSDCGALCEGKCSQLGKGPFACPEICLPPACACSPGKYRNDAGLCVASRDCPLTQPTEASSSKGSYVDEPITPKPETGKTYVDEPITPRPKNGQTYVDEPITPKPDTGKSYIDEPGTQCSANETLNGCGNLCEGKCENLGKGPIACPAICGPPACACKEGYYRNAGGVCVTVRDCPLVCGNNEEINNCGNLCEPTCENAFGKVSKARNLTRGHIACPAVCEPPACACKDGYFRNKEGKCVRTIDCSLNCGTNEQVNPCGSRCEPTCENAFGQPKFCVKICDPPACVCKSNYYRKDGQCVPQMGCGIPGKPGKTSPVSKPGGAVQTGNKYGMNQGTKPLVCGRDEVVNPCGSLCEPTCENAFGKLKPCPRICKPPACVCKPDYYRKDGKCVPQQSCEKPRSAGTDTMTSYGDEPIVPDGQNNSCEDSECEEGMVCVEGETESVCVAKDPANNCETTICPTGAVCEYRETECIPDKACFAEAVCVEHDSSGSTPKPTGTTKTYVDEPETGGPEPNPCFNFPCPTGQECSLQSGEAKCVSKGMKCSVNETFSQCGNICEGKCSNVGNIPRPCLPICAPEACACKDGFYRNEAGDCVEKKECVLTLLILTECGENEKVNNCGRHCENSCTQAGKGPTKCKPPCNEPACVCDDGYYRNTLGKCVLERLCSTTCPPNEHGSACGDLCELSCDEQLNKERELPCIEVCAPPACVCNDGYLRLKRGGPCVPKNSCPKKSLPIGSSGDNSNPYKKRRYHSQ
ncbi:hypothetical protein Aduo_016355 [Ancylostoma duodenale]